MWSFGAKQPLAADGSPLCSRPRIRHVRPQNVAIVNRFGCEPEAFLRQRFWVSDSVCSCRFSQADQWEVFLGLHIQSQTSKWTVKRNVKQIITHHDYNPTTYNNDIALMELDADVTLNQNIWPICLPSPTYHFPVGSEAWITGWGATIEGGECPGENKKAFARLEALRQTYLADETRAFPREDIDQGWAIL